jgi:hypothetical protein
MEWAWSAEGSFRIGFLATITADKSGVKLEFFHLLDFSTLCQLANMHLVVFRVAA